MVVLQRARSGDMSRDDRPAPVRCETGPGPASGVGEGVVAMARTEARTYRINEQIEHGNEERSEEGRGEHPADDPRPDRVSRPRPRPGRERQGHDAHDER